MHRLAIVAALLLAGCTGGSDACGARRAETCFDDGTCIEGSRCDLEYHGIRGIGWFSGELDLERGLQALQLAGHREARLREDGTALVATNITVEPLRAGGWWYVRTFAEEPATNLSGADVAARGEARWALIGGGFRNALLRFHGSYETDPERVGWAPLLARP